MELNSNQQLAVSHKSGPCLVLAGPGSGKTAVLTCRIMELIKSSVPAEEILVITFTKAAAIEMKERFDRLSQEIYPVTFGTFHSLFWGILQRELGYKSSDIVMGSQRNKLIKEAMRIADLDFEDGVLSGALISELSTFNNSVKTMEEYIPKFADKRQLIAFKNAYEKLKQQYRLIDFDDMLIKAYKLFESKPAVLSKWQNKYSYFLIDEMQDMNDIQFQLIRMLSAKTNNLFCVGDDDQSIYGFRGANPKIMAKFEEVYPDTTRILLDYNYRNPCNVVASASVLISKNNNRFEKDIKSVNKEGQINILEYEDLNKESEGLITNIKQLILEGCDPGEIAVLYRNHSDARFLVDGLINAGIPFYLKESMPNIYTHFIINDIETYFQLAVGNGTKSRILSVMNKPNRYLHRRSVEVGGSLKGMCSFYKDNPGCLRNVQALMTDLNLLNKMSAQGAINYIKKGMEYSQYLYEEALKQQVNYKDYEDILDFLKGVLKDCKTLNQAIDKIQALRLKIDFENKQNKDDKEGKVGLYTLHSSKGLEFSNVFIISVNEGIIPTNKADTKEEIEAERRLFYVGITRTKKNLFLSYTNKKNRDKSRFLVELNYSSSKSSSQTSSNLAETASYSSSDSILSSEGAPVSSSL